RARRRPRPRPLRAPLLPPPLTDAETASDRPRRGRRLAPRHALPRPLLGRRPGAPPRRRPGPPPRSRRARRRGWHDLRVRDRAAPARAPRPDRGPAPRAIPRILHVMTGPEPHPPVRQEPDSIHTRAIVLAFVAARSEERRVGKECRSRRWRYQ